MSEISMTSPDQSCALNVVLVPVRAMSGIGNDGGPMHRSAMHGLISSFDRVSSVC